MMKKISSMILAVTMLLSVLLVPSNALSTPVSKSSNDAQVSDIQVSDIIAHTAHYLSHLTSLTHIGRHWNFTVRFPLATEFGGLCPFIQFR